ncbi:MAG: hypothetical protein ACP5UR_00835, partial [Chloroflexus sp.]|uniref:hypothetical protein n=1 Tax=Chloroflexus sp. TaxID=1904827 RepID=UPI003C7660F1
MLAYALRFPFPATRRMTISYVTLTVVLLQIVIEQLGCFIYLVTAAQQAISRTLILVISLSQQPLCALPYFSCCNNSSTKRQRSSL